MSVLSQISWGQPDSPMRELCALCHTALPEVPLIIWKADGSAASFCDDCAEVVFRAMWRRQKKPVGAPRN